MRRKKERVLQSLQAATKLVEDGIELVKVQDHRVAEHRRRVAQADAHQKISAA